MGVFFSPSCLYKVSFYVFVLWHIGSSFVVLVSSKHLYEGCIEDTFVTLGYALAAEI